MDDNRIHLSTEYVRILYNTLYGVVLLKCGVVWVELSPAV